MRYVIARLEEEERELAYRIYVTDALQNIPQQRYSVRRWIDMIQPQRIDNRSGDEIAFDVITKAGLRLHDDSF